jgi:hypothetical protein
MRGWFPGGRVPSLVVSTEVVSLFSLMTLLLACAAFLEPVGPTDEALIQGQLPTYPVATCVISDELLEEGEIVDVVVEGRLVRVCCSGCARRVKAAPARAIAKIDRAVIDQQVAAYPLKTCLKNIQEPLSGSAVNAVVGTRLVRTCCLDCAQQVKAEPAAFMRTLDAAYTAQQLPDYAVETCVVSDEPLDEDALNVLYGNTLVRLCCKGCHRTFTKEPELFMKKIGASEKSKRKPESHGVDRDGSHDDDHDG